MLYGHIWGGEAPQHWWQTVWQAVGKGVRVAARLGWRTALEALSGDEMVGHGQVPPRYYGQPTGVFEADRVVNQHLKKLAANRNLMGRLASGQPLDTRQAMQLHAFTATLEARAKTLREKQAAKLFGRHAKLALAGNLGVHGLPPAKGQRHFGNANKPPWVNWASAADRVSSPFVGQTMVTPSWPDHLWRGVRNSVQQGADQIKLRDWHGLRWSGVKQPAKGQPKGQKGLVPAHIVRAPTPETGYDSLVRSNDELDDGVLAARQRTLNALFRGPVFSTPEIAHPKPQVMEKAVANRNIGQMIAVANWILWRKASSVWQSLELKDIQNKLQDRHRWISPAKERQLAIALKLNAILKRNEADESKRDDARAFADGLQVLIDANTRDDVVDEARLIEDMKFFMIDQPKDGIGLISKLLHGFSQSNTAYNLYAGPRIGATGWKRDYRDHGQLYERKNKKYVLINQVHHFTAFLIVRLENGNSYFPLAEAYFLDSSLDKNTQDVRLGFLAIAFGEILREDPSRWKYLPDSMYFALKEEK